MYWVFNTDQLNDAIDSLTREQEEAGQNRVESHLDAAAIRYFLTSKHAARAGLIHELAKTPKPEEDTHA